MGQGLSESDVVARLFSPSASLPHLADKKYMVVVAHGVEHSATLRETENLMLRAFTHLKAEGIGAGDNVIFCAENGLEFSPTLLACWALQATATLIDFRIEPVELFAACKKLKAKLLITSRPLSELALNSDDELEGQCKFINIADFSKLKTEPSEAQIDFKNIDLDLPLLALFTSGTTGAPKTAVHNLRSLMQNVADLAEAVDMPEGMTGVTPLPVSHVFGLTVLLVTHVLGIKIVLTALDPISFIKAVHGYKPHLIAALPQFYGALLSAPKGIIDLSDARLLLSGGAPLTVSLAQKFEKVFGKQLNNGYGSTESKIFAFNKNGPVLSVGKAIGQVKIEIVDVQGEPLPDGSFGEVIIISPTLMEGYWRDEDKTKKVLSGDKYKTGDYGHLEDGFLFVAGRYDDVAIVSGVVVHLAEIEEKLRANPVVKEAAVTAHSNKWLGQVIKASVVLMDDDCESALKSTNQVERQDAKRALVRQFKAFCKEQLPRHKRPMLWHFLGPHDDLPKTLAGKVDKKALENL